MALPAFDIKNELKMKLIKNSMDINLKEDVPDLRKLNLFKVAKALEHFEFTANNLISTKV